MEIRGHRANRPVPVDQAAIRRRTDRSVPLDQAPDRRLFKRRLNSRQSPLFQLSWNRPRLKGIIAEDEAHKKEKQARVDGSGDDGT